MADILCWGWSQALLSWKILPAVLLCRWKLRPRKGKSPGQAAQGALQSLCATAQEASVSPSRERLALCCSRQQPLAQSLRLTAEPWGQVLSCAWMSRVRRLLNCPTGHQLGVTPPCPEAPLCLQDLYSFKAHLPCLLQAALPALPSRRQSPLWLP